MKCFNFSGGILNKVFIIFFIFNFIQVNAQDNIRDLESKYNVKIDSIFLKATPYRQIEKDGIISDEDKKIDWYNNITIYEIQPNQNNGYLKKEAAKPALFMIPGGGFYGISPVDTLQMISITDDITFGSMLADSLHLKVYVIVYETTSDPLLNNLVFPFKEFNDYENCKKLKNETARAKITEASYKSFRDLRKILKENYLDSAIIKGIDTNKFFMMGSSAGAILALNTLFLQQNEIPSSLTYNTELKIGSLIFCPSSVSATINISDSVRNSFWPIPKMKGIIPMSGAWIYEESLLTENTPTTTDSAWLFLIHGTCDELVHRRNDKISFKRLKLILSPLSLDYEYNSYPINRFLEGYGSENIFNALKDSHKKLRYGQVVGGGHAPFDNPNSAIVGAWEKTSSTGSTLPLYNQVKPFLDSLINNTLSNSVRAYPWLPEAFTSFCKPFDEPLDTIAYSKEILSKIANEDYLKSAEWIIKVNPNPVKNTAFVQLKKLGLKADEIINDIFPLLLISSNGEIMQRAYINNGYFELNVANFIPGIYKILVQVNDGVVFTTLNIIK
ncbi:MAG: hypothetical protein M9958_05025 [Chitinophagales bacterium]|nr:hypothetical protein [Chitinophagales bacterium]